jgi:hypothetical protein
VRLDPTQTAKVLELAGVKGAAAADGDGRKLLPASFTPPATWVVPVYVVAGDNARGWRSRVGRSGYERAAVHRTLAVQYAALVPFVEAIQAGRIVRVTLTRLGPGAMDFGNVVAALKYVQDGVAERFGVDDGSPLFDWRYAAEKAAAYGVRVEVEGA